MLTQGEAATKAFLEHYGIKGMKWGVRRPRGKNGRVKRDSSRTTYSKAPKKLTDSELSRRIQRMESEKKYNSLNRRDVSPGERLVSDVLTSSGSKIAKTVATNAGTIAVGLLIAKKFGPEAAANLTKKIK